MSISDHLSSYVSLQSINHALLYLMNHSLERVAVDALQEPHDVNGLLAIQIRLWCKFV